MPAYLHLTHLIAALLLGVPLGLAGDVAWQALSHPSFRWLLLHHPGWAIPSLLGPAAVLGVGAVTGLGVPGGMDALRGWMVVAACVIYVWSDRSRG